MKSSTPSERVDSVQVLCRQSASSLPWHERRQHHNLSYKRAVHWKHLVMMRAELVLPMPGGPLSSTARLLRSFGLPMLLGKPSAGCLWM